MATGYPLVQLVDGPNQGARVLFDFNDNGLTWADRSDFSLGAPELLGDPGGIGAEYGWRRPQLRLDVLGGEARALAVLSRLARTLQRDECWLYFRLTPTAEPMWLRCVRATTLGDLSFARVLPGRARNMWTLAVSLVADPFAVGEPRSYDFEVVNSPGASANPMSVVLPAIRGDAPTPLVVDVAPFAGVGIGSFFAQPWLTVTPVDGPWPGVQTVKPTSSASADSGAFQGVSLAIPSTDASPMAVRRQEAWKAPYAGRWRIFARLRRTTLSSAVVTIQGGGASVVDPVTTVLPGAGEATMPWQLVDLGVFAFPKGNPPPSRPYEVGMGSFELHAAFSGASPLRLDYYLLVPLDLPLDTLGPATETRFVRTGWGHTVNTTRIDGEANPPRVSLLSGGMHVQATAETPSGGFPMATPGATNVLHFLPRLHYASGIQVDELTRVTRLTVSHRPRWLWMASL